MTMDRRLLVAVGAIALAACSGSVASHTATRPTVSAATATPPSPSPTAMPSPTRDAAAQYTALAVTVNREWKAIGTPQAADKLSVPGQQVYVVQWYALENEIATGLTTMDWPASASREEATMEAAVNKLQTLLQPSGSVVGYLGLIAFQPLNDQRASAAAVRVTLGLPPMGPADLI